MVKKLNLDEKEFLFEKYLSMGCSRRVAEKRLNRTIKLMVVSTITMII